MIRGLALVILILAVPSIAAAQRRVVGAGGSVGGGVSAPDYAPVLVVPNQLGIDLAGLSPAPFELVVPVDDHFAIDVTLPIPMLLESLVFDTLAVGTNVYAEWSVGEHDVRFLVGPGLGLALYDYFDDHASTGSIAGSVTARALVGVELFFARRSYGVRFMTRPWIGVGTGARDLGDCVGRSGVMECYGNTTSLVGGAMLEIALIGYVTEDD